MPRLASPRMRLDRSSVAFFAGPVLLVWLMCAAVQAAIQAQAVTLSCAS